MRIGIITQYYKSKNYGGNLQAYALCNFLNTNGFYAEQICYASNNGTTENIVKKVRRVTVKKIYKKMSVYLKKIYINLFFRKRCAYYKDAMTERRKKFEHFNQGLICHSNNVYTDETLVGCVSDYDAFITGSDQVWNNKMFRKGYYLNFVPSEKIKMSYAASVASSRLGEEQKQYMKVALNDFDAVSVREADTIQLLDEVTPVTVSLVVDPTLLLSHSEWEEVCDERLIQEPYMFCYFLGKNEKSRELCHEYAKTHHIKIVNIPMVNNGYYFHDKHQSDMMMYNASPEEFLSLIKYAEIVFTDSFHATVLSHIFQKQYVIFKRDKKDDMSSRIYDVTRVFGTEERYCCNETLETLEYIENMRDIEYKENPILEEFISRSKEFLVRNLHE